MGPISFQKYPVLGKRILPIFIKLRVAAKSGQPILVMARKRMDGFHIRPYITSTFSMLSFDVTAIPGVDPDNICLSSSP